MEDIFWGNLYKEQEQIANKVSGSYKSAANYFMADEFIFPDLSQTRNEVQILINEINKKQKDMKEYNSIDDDAFGYFTSVGDKLGVNSRDSRNAIEFIKSKISPLVLDLKRYWNRARPYQYGYLFELPLHPHKSKSGVTTPCYPSGHSLQAIAYKYYILNKYPQLNKQLSQMAEKVHKSRIALGVHFESDIKFSIEIGEYLRMNNLFV